MVVHNPHTIGDVIPTNAEIVDWESTTNGDVYLFTRQHPEVYVNEKEISEKFFTRKPKGFYQKILEKLDRSANLDDTVTCVFPEERLNIICIDKDNLVVTIALWPTRKHTHVNFVACTNGNFLHSSKSLHWFPGNIPGLTDQHPYGIFAVMNNGVVDDANANDPMHLKARKLNAQMESLVQKAASLVTEQDIAWTERIEKDFPECQTVRLSKKHAQEVFACEIDN